MARASGGDDVKSGGERGGEEREHEQSGLERGGKRAKRKETAAEKRAVTS
jgi:hypothetical protein